MLCCPRTLLYSIFWYHSTLVCYFTGKYFINIRMWQFFILFAIILTVLYVCKRPKQEKNGGKKSADALLEKSDISDIFGHDLLDMAT